MERTQHEGTKRGRKTSASKINEDLSGQQNRKRGVMGVSLQIMGAENNYRVLCEGDERYE